MDIIVNKILRDLGLTNEEIIAYCDNTYNCQLEKVLDIDQFECNYNFRQEFLKDMNCIKEISMSYWDEYDFYHDDTFTLYEDKNHIKYIVHCNYITGMGSDTWITQLTNNSYVH